MKPLALLILCLFSIGCRPSPSSLVAESSLGSNQGELVRLKGSWMANGDRRSNRVVSDEGINMIQTTTSEYNENFGCPYTSYRTIQMTYSPATKTYQAKMKWGGNTLLEHRQEDWLKTRFNGVWDPNKRTLSWIGNLDGKNIKFTIRIIDDNKQSIEIVELDGDRIIQKLAASTFGRLL